MEPCAPRGINVAGDFLTKNDKAAERTPPTAVCKAPDGTGTGSRVGLPEDFRKRALEYFRWAQVASASEDRAAWLSMAEFWHRLAQRAEQGDHTPTPEPPRGESPDSSRRSG